jgi:hypothetical protein
MQETAVMKSPAFRVVEFSLACGVLVHVRRQGVLIMVVIRRS